MTQYKQNYELKNAAKDMLDGKYTGAVLILVLNFLITNIVTLFIDSIGTVTLDTVYMLSGPGPAHVIVNVIFNALLILASIICAVMDVGVTLYFLKLACGHPLSFGDLFYGFRNDSRKSLAISTAMVLCRIACLWPFQYLAFHAGAAPQALFPGAQLPAPDAPVRPKLRHRASLAGALYADDLYMLLPGSDEPSDRCFAKLSFVFKN